MRKKPVGDLSQTPCSGMSDAPCGFHETRLNHRACKNYDCGLPARFRNAVQLDLVIPDLAFVRLGNAHEAFAEAPLSSVGCTLRPW
jgi:hypothetical protein